MRIDQLQWQQTIAIRHTVLWPNKPADFCRVNGDEHALHYGVYIDEVLVSVASIYRDNNCVRLRKFATLPDYQGRGIGTYLLNYIIDECRNDNITALWCDAREDAMAFYHRLGLIEEGERFYKSGVAYFIMRLVF